MPHDNSRFGPVHLAVATPLTQDEVHALGAEQGWVTQRRSRGGMFDVIELWREALSRPPPVPA